MHVSISSTGGPTSIYDTRTTLGTDESHAHVCSLVLLSFFLIWHNTKTKTTCNFHLLLCKKIFLYLRAYMYVYIYIYIYIYIYVKSIILFLQ